MRKLTSLLFILLSFFSIVNAQVEFHLADKNVDKGDTLEVKVTVQNFNGVNFFEYRQSYDTLVLEFVDLIDIHTELAGLAYAGPMDRPQATNYVQYSWLENTGGSVNIPDGNSLYTMRFVAVGQEGDTTTIKFGPTNNAFEIFDENDNELPHTEDNGLITINGGGSGGAEDFKVFMSDASGDKGDEVCIDLSVDNFTDIETMQLAFKWNKDVAKYVTTKDYNLKDFNAGSVSNVRPGVLRIIWSEGSAGSHTLVGKTRIATICYDLIGNGGTSTDVVLEQDGIFTIEVTNETEELTVVPDNGKLTINGGGGGGNDNFTFIASKEKADKNSNVCVDVSVREFTDVVGMQFGMAWDKSTLTNANIQNTNLEYLTAAGSFNILDGELICSWSDPLVEGESVANNTVIFQLCFTTSSDCGAKSSVIFKGSGNNPIELFDVDDNDIAPIDLEHGEVEIDCGGGGGGDDFVLSVGSGSVKKDEEICLDVNVENFVDVEVMQFSMMWDTNVLEFTRIANIDLQGFNSGIYLESPKGKLRVAWSLSSGDAVTFPDGKMFQICFKGLACDEESDVMFTESPLPYEVVNENGDELNVVVNNGNVNVTCDVMQDMEVSVAGKKDVRCRDDENGSIGITVSGATSYTYQWYKDGVKFSVDKSITKIGPGEYYVVVTDANDPSRTVTLPVCVLRNPPVLVLNTIRNNRDNGNCTGLVEVKAEGGWGKYNYRWVLPQGGGTNPILTNACKGETVVNVIDSNNCNVRDTIIVFGAEIEDNAEITALKCNDDCNAEIKLSPTGGCEPFTYNWSGNGVDQSAKDQDKLCAGTYFVTITDSLGDKTVTSYTIDNPAGMTIDTIEVINGNNGSINIDVTGGTEPYSYVWTDEDGNVVGMQEDLVGVNAGTYTVVVTDNNGCTQTRTIVIVPSNFEVNSTTSDISCNGDNDGWIELVVTGIANESYEWSHDASLNDARAENLKAGDYTVIIKDSKGNTVRTLSFTLSEPDAIVISDLVEINCASSKGAKDGSYEVIVTGGTPGYDYEWCNGETTAKAVRLEGDEDCDLTITDANGCQLYRDEIAVCYDTTGIPPPPSDCYEGRKVISPNDDGKNDYLLITCDDDYPNKLFVFDRWGRPVFEAANYQSTTGIGWTGVDNDGTDLNEGGYMWVLRVDLPNGDQRIYRGTVILVR